MAKLKIGHTDVQGIKFEVIVENGYLLLRNSALKHKNWFEVLKGFKFIYNDFRKMEIGNPHDNRDLAKLLNELQKDYIYEESGEITLPSATSENQTLNSIKNPMTKNATRNRKIN